MYPCDLSWLRYILLMVQSVIVLEEPASRWGKENEERERERVRVEKEKGEIFQRERFFLKGKGI